MRPEACLKFDMECSKVKQINRYCRNLSMIQCGKRVSDVLDSVYCILDGKVQPYKYLETWIIREKGTKRYVVISDIQNLVPAMDIFRPDTEWIIEFLDKPYKPDNTYNAGHNKVKVESFTWE